MQKWRLRPWFALFPRRRLGAAVAAACALQVPGGVAQIATDGTVGGPGNLGNPQILSGAGSTAPVAIGEALGSRPGGGANLFHSFSDFNVNTGQTVTFTGSAGIAQILSRVTGANASSIDGTLASTIDGADLWLLNPNGVVFGENASLDLLGSLRATTADYIELADGLQYGATTALPPDPNTLLTVASPTAFGFLGAGNGTISVNGATLDADFDTENGIALVGGPVEINDAQVRTAIGGIDILGVAGAGTVRLGGEDAGPGAASAFAPVTIRDSLVAVSADPDSVVDTGGGIHVRGARVELDDSAISSYRFGGNFGPVQLQADSLLLTDSSVRSDTLRAPDSAPIRLIADTITLVGSSVSSETFPETESSQGNAADIEFVATDVLLQNSGVRSASSSFSEADSGQLLFGTADNPLASLRLTEGASIEVEGSFDGPGAAREIRIFADILDVYSGSQVANRPGDSAGADVIVNAGVITLDNGSIKAVAPIRGGGARLRIDADAIYLRDGSIDSSTGTFGGAGTILIGQTRRPDIIELTGADAVISTASTDDGEVLDAGASGTVEINAARLALRDFAAISNSTDGGRGGEATLNVDVLTLDNGSTVTVGTDGTGNAGNLLINASDSVTLSGQSSISASSTLEGFFNGDPPGRAGTVTVRTPRLTLASGSQITASTAGGLGGAVRLLADSLEATGAGTAITATTEGFGDGGDIIIAGSGSGGSQLESADSVVLGDGAQMRSDSAQGDPQSGSAGNILVLARRIALDGGSGISATTNGGPGGQIALGAQELVVRGGAAVVAGTTGLGSGGTITLGPGLFNNNTVLIEGGVVNSSTSSLGDAGTITVDATSITVSGAGAPRGVTAGIASDSLASGERAGAGGQVTLNADALTVAESGEISVSVVDGASGQIDFNVEELRLLSGGTLRASTAGTGEGGTIDLLVPELVIDGGRITTSASGTGNAGTINIGGAASPQASLVIGGATGLVASDSSAVGTGAGAAGTVNIYALDLVVEDMAQVSVSTTDGDSGQLNLFVNNLTLNGEGTLTASTFGVAEGGFIDLSNVRALELNDRGTITSATAGSGDGGTIVVNTPVLRFNGGRITTSASASGDAGTITVGSELRPYGDLFVGGELSSDSTGTGAGAGNAGTVRIFADNLRLGGDALVSVSTRDGASGTVVLNVESLTVSDAATLTASTSGSADGGDLDFSDLRELVIRDNGTISAATAGSGAGGTIAITVPVLRFEGGSVTTSASGSGDAGTIRIGSQGAPYADLVIRGQVSSDSSGTGNAGAAGTVAIFATDLAVDDDGVISVSTRDGASGQLALAVDTLTLAGNGTLTASTSGSATGGSIALDGVRVLTLRDNGTITSGSSGSGDGGTIALDVPEIHFDGGQVTTSASGSGRAGTITLGSAANPLQPIAIRGLLSSDSTGTGPDAGAAGTIRVFAENLALLEGGQLSVSTVDGGSGQIDINVNALEVNDGASIVAQTSGAGQGGTIFINANDDRSNTLRVAGGAINTSASGSGAAGQIIVVADSVELTGADAKTRSGIFSDSVATGDNAGAAGTIDMRGGSLAVADGGELSVSTVDGGSGQLLLAFDTVDVGAGGTITAQTTGAGDGGTITIAERAGAASRLAIAGGSINTNAAASGAAGRIAIDMDSVAVSGPDGSGIFSDSTAAGFDAGAAGSLQIAADDLTVEQGGALSVSTVDGAGGQIVLGNGTLLVRSDGRVVASTAGTGAGGTIAIGGRDGGSAGRVEVAGGEITTSTTGSGAAGSINIDALQMFISGAGGVRGGLFSESGVPVQVQALGRSGVPTLATAGSAGSIQLTLSSLVMSDAAQISVQSFDDGDAGSVNISSSAMSMNQSSINAQTAVGAGGAIAIANLSEVYRMVDSDISAFSASGDPNSQGNISISDPPAIILERSSIRALSANQAGGNVNLEADAIIFDAQSVIEGSGEVFTSGEVLATVVEVKEPEIVDVTEGLADRCSAQQVQNRSSLTIQTISPDAVHSNFLGAADDGAAPGAYVACRPPSASAD